jgi:acetyl-CoA carboxylase biotin carboxylase subunit
MTLRKPITKVLVANRGEIAVRVMRTCREMGLGSVAIYSDADRGSLHVRHADEAVRVGPPPARDSYLAVDRIIDAAKKTGADAVHPGYGFLAERPELARAVERAGMTFVGPRPETMEVVAVKPAARRRMRDAGVPTVPGSEGPLDDEADARAFADALGYPVMIKAAAGRGGKGMQRCDRGEDFAGRRLYLEKVLDRPRHVEVQVFADEHGDVVQLGDRECSVQRRHQKVIEEGPSCALDEGSGGPLGRWRCAPPEPSASAARGRWSSSSTRSARSSSSSCTRGCRSSTP